MAENRNTRHETRDLSFKGIAGFGIALLVMLIVASVALAGLFSYFAAHQAKSDTLPSMVTPQLPPQPRLEVVPANTLSQLRAMEDQLLTTYGWVDRQNGIVRIPIDRAMDLLAHKGLPVRWDKRNPVYEF